MEDRWIWKNTMTKKIGRTRIMRLIDADKLKEDLEDGRIVIDEHILECDNAHEILVYLLEKVEACVNENIDAQPTVEAIPKAKLDEIVERLEKHIRYCELCHEEFKNESMSLIYEVQINSYKNAIEIVKEVGGMNE